MRAAGWLIKIPFVNYFISLTVFRPGTVLGGKKIKVDQIMDPLS